MLTFFGGKGGVGKTTLANAYSYAAASRGERVLLVSTDPAHNLGHIWGQRIGDNPRQVDPDLPLSLLELDPQRTIEQHITTVSQNMREVVPERLHKQLQHHLDLSATTPGMHEAALLERIADIATTPGYDRIVFDTAPSGHTSRLMALPELMTAWSTALLERREQSDKFADIAASFGNDRVASRNQRIRQVVYQRQQKFAQLRTALVEDSEFHIVLIAERLAVLETVEFYQDLRAHDISVGQLFVNRRSPASLPGRVQAETSALELLCQELPQATTTEIPLLDHEVGTPAGIAEVARLVFPTG